MTIIKASPKIIRYSILSLLIISVCFSCCNQTKKIQTDMYFGLSTKTGIISPEQWNNFKTQTLDEALSGYTELDAKGYWQSASGQKYRENSKVIIYIHNDSSGEFSTLDSIIKVYKTQFSQESVLEVHKEVSVSFNQS